MSDSRESPPPDSFISPDDGIKYWEGISADVNGMLGGFPSISRVDLQGSRAFLARLGIGVKNGRSKIARALEGGAGIGRITEGLLLSIAEQVDIVEPVAKFTAALKEKNGVGEVYNIGLEDWQPADGVQYDLIWTQWCVGHLTDEQLVRYLQRCQTALAPDGVIVLKENMSTSGRDIFDDVDSSVTRLDEKFRSIFEQAGLKIVRTDVQKGFPGNLTQQLFPVRIVVIILQSSDNRNAQILHAVIEIQSSMRFLESMITTSFHMSFLRKALDTATTVGRFVDTYAIKPHRGVCPHCNNLGPLGHPESSNNSHGLWDESTSEERQAVYGGATWLTLEITVAKLSKTVNEGFAKSVKPCIYCQLILEALQYYLPNWFASKEDNSGQGDESEEEADSMDEDQDSTSDTAASLPEDNHEDLTLVFVENKPATVRTHVRDAARRYSIFAFEIGRKSDATHSLIPSCGPFIERSSSSDDKASWEFIHNCVQQCNRQHGQCLDSQNAKKLPKRVLDLESGPSLLQLSETQPGKTALYAALSHCWGLGHPLRTLLGNIEQMKAGIKVKDLDETFRNAVRICRELGVRYLWIDSLCIIQDSTDDWTEQAALMADIYKNAYITITTGSSPGPDTSIFRERDAIWKSWTTQLGAGDEAEHVQVRRKVLPVIEVPDRNNSVHLATYHDRHAGHALWEYQWDGPLYNRAWCFQEQFLSKRMLHFTPGAIIWECSSLRHVEGETPTPILGDEQSASMQSKTWTTEWQNNVTNYTKRSITFSSDRIVALSGIASNMAQKANDQYLAGLWKSSLIWDLLWYPSPWKEEPVPERYLAPSWSWASLGGQATWSSYKDSDNLKIYVEVLNAETVIKTPLNPYGDVTSGSITLRGPAFQGLLISNVEWIESDQGPVRITGSWEKKGGGYYVLPDVRLYEADGLLEDRTTEKTSRRARPGEEYARSIDEEGDFISYFMQVTVLCFLHTTSSGVVGLVLGRSTTVPGAYTRLATVRKLPISYKKRATVGDFTIV